MKGIFQDWPANVGNWKARLVLVAFRLAARIRALPTPLVVLLSPYLILYRVGVEWILGIELPWKLQVGPGLRLFQGMELVVNGGALAWVPVRWNNGWYPGGGQSGPNLVEEVKEIA